MDAGRDEAALGALLLAVVLILPVALPEARARAAGAPALAPLQADAPPAGAGPLQAAAMGWPVACDESDPNVWERLDGVGPALGGRLARAAADGAIQAPSDLLQVHGIGVRMAGVIGPRLACGAEPPTE
jgi:hypothetical protein